MKLIIHQGAVKSFYAPLQYSSGSPLISIDLGPFYSSITIIAYCDKYFWNKLSFKSYTYL